MRRLSAVTAAVVFALAFGSPRAQARTSDDLRYRYEHVWNAAVRLIRVEMGLAISERDAETGFFLFSYVDHDKQFPGSVELVRHGGEEQAAVSVVVHVGGMPRYIERMILSKLSKKLENEHGPPRPPRKERPPNAPAKRPEQDREEGAGDGDAERG